jgi:hypothetical protein
MSEHLFQVLLLLVGSAVGAIATGTPGWIRRRKKELIAEGARIEKENTRDAAIANETKERGKLEQRVDDVEEDINNVAKGNRILYDALEKRVAAIDKKGSNLEVYVTGKMPRVSGEGGVTK